jgi:hypothetical protein
MYCSVDDIKAYWSSDQLRNKQLPPTGELLSLAAQIGAELTGFMKLYGYAIPVIDLDLLAYLKTANAMGVAALVDIKLRPAGEAMVNDLESKYREMKKLLADHGYHDSVYVIPDVAVNTW